MKSLCRITRLGQLAAFFALFFIAGCLTSPNPFYEDSDIIQDPRFVGFFVDENCGLTATISVDKALKDHYMVSLADYGCTANYLATLFKLKNSVFVDLVPLSDEKTLKTSIEGYPSAGDLLQTVSHDVKISTSTRLHVLYRLSVSDQRIECFGAKSSDDSSNPITTHANVEFHTNGDGLVLDEPTAKVRSIAESYAGTNWEQLFESQPNYSEDSVLELVRTNKDQFSHVSDKADYRAFSFRLPENWEEINKDDPEPKPYIRFQGGDSTEFGVSIRPKSSGFSLATEVNKERDDWINCLWLRDQKSTATEITNWSRYTGKGYDIEFMGHEEMPPVQVTVFGFENSNNVCIVYEYAWVSDFEKYARDFKKIRETFRLK